MISHHAPLGWCRTDLMYCLSDLSWGAKLCRCVCTVLEHGICAVCVNGLIHGRARLALHHSDSSGHQF